MLDVGYPLPIVKPKQGLTIPKRTDGLPSFWKKNTLGGTRIRNCYIMSGPYAIYTGVFFPDVQV